MVDDDPVTRAFVADVLTASGYDAYTCVDGESALGSFMRNAPFVLMVVDILLPGIRGTQVVNLLRRASADLRVLYVSARASSPALEPGDAFLAKPFTREALNAEVKRIMAAGA